MQAPCKDCPDRKLGCHSVCEKYIAFDNYRKEVRAKHQAELDLRYAIYSLRKKKQERKWW